MPPLIVKDVVGALASLRRVRPKVFGSDQHGFVLNPALPEGRVLNFEHNFAMRLPPEYRDFITKIGDGGAGPFYGIFPMGFVDDTFALREWHVKDGVVGDPSRPFSFEKEWNDTSLMPAPELADTDQAEFERRTENFEQKYWRPDVLNGAIPICHQGCALRIWLVVTGDAAGQLWDDRRSEYGGIRPLRLADGSIATFRRWYDEWLHECMKLSANK